MNPLIIVAVVVVLLVVFVISVYNSLVGLRNKVKEAFATMDVYLKQRFDLIPNLVETVKGYAKHESETLEKVTQMRVGAEGGIDARVEGEKKISEAIRQIMVVAENYPDLKASENFRELQTQLASVETDIANARRYYNGSVREYNNKCQMVPYNIIANSFGFKEMPMFEVESASERQNVQVKF